jgi:hypothetical protein
MTGIDDAETIEKVTEAICASTGKLDFHNRLMKLFGAETSSAYYNMIKPYYEIAKRIFAEIDKRTSDNAEAQPDVSPCENTEPEKADSTAAAQEQISEPAPKKVDAAMKKRLHQILDEPATFDEFSGIVAQINQSATLQQLYINMIQRFKKDRGRELYGLIKTEYKKFISEQEKTEEASAAAEDEVQTKKADGAMKKKLHALLDDKTSADEFAATVDIVNRSAGTHELYLGMIKRFGKKRGLVIYNEIKKEFTAFVSPAKKA